AGIADRQLARHVVGDVLGIDVGPVEGPGLLARRALEVGGAVDDYRVVPVEERGRRAELIAEGRALRGDGHRNDLAGGGVLGVCAADDRAVDGSLDLDRQQHGRFRRTGGGLAELRVGALVHRRAHAVVDVGRAFQGGRRTVGVAELLERLAPSSGVRSTVTPSLLNCSGSEPMKEVWQSSWPNAYASEWGCVGIASELGSTLEGSCS